MITNVHFCNSQRTMATLLYCRWKFALPFVMFHAFCETRRFLRNIRIVSEVVDEIVKKKRQQLEQDEGYTSFIVINVKNLFDLLLSVRVMTDDLH